jgi:hypothetical protein
MVDVLDLRWMRYVDESHSSLNTAVLTDPRMHRRLVGPLTFVDQKSPPPRWQQGPNIRHNFLETGVRCALGTLQDAEGKLSAQTTTFQDQANDTADMAHLYSLVLLFLLRRNHGHIPLAALFRARTSFVVAPRP